MHKYYSFVKLINISILLHSNKMFINKSKILRIFLTITAVFIEHGWQKYDMVIENQKRPLVILGS